MAVQKGESSRSGEGPFRGRGYRDKLRRELEDLIDALELDPKRKKALKARWLDQLIWMSKRASDNKKYYFSMKVPVVILSVLLPILISLPDFPYRSHVTVAVSASVAVLTALESFYNFGEKWRHYRRVAETLKSEGWNYIQLSGDYGRFSSHERAYARFAGKVEEIIRWDVEKYLTDIVREVEIPESGTAKQKSGAEALPHDDVTGAGGTT